MSVSRCKLCRGWADMSYEVQRDKPVSLCGACMGKFEPKELNARLGVTPDDEVTNVDANAK